MMNNKRASLGMIFFALLWVVFVSPCWADEEVTIHKIGCDGNWLYEKPSYGGCVGNPIDLSTTYKALVDKQEVLYWSTDGKSEIRKFHKCNIRDTKNWDCNEMQGDYIRAVVSMRDGLLVADSLGSETYHPSWLEYNKGGFKYYPPQPAQPVKDLPSQPAQPVKDLPFAVRALVALAGLILIAGVVYNFVKPIDKKKVISKPSPPPSYSDNGNGTVRDHITGMVWQKDDDGQKRNWDEAMEYAKSLSLGGYPDWRLPTKDELSFLRENTETDKKIRATYFPSMKLSNYWSSSLVGNMINDPNFAWYLDFHNGADNFDEKKHKYYVRCVRLEQ